MDLLAEKFNYHPEKRTSKVPAHKQTISWTHLMRENFEKIKTSLCEACSLYIPSDQGEFAIHTDASDHGIGAVLEQKDDQGNWRPCAFFSPKLDGSLKYNADRKCLGLYGQESMVGEGKGDLRPGVLSFEVQKLDIRAPHHCFH